MQYTGCTWSNTLPFLMSRAQRTSVRSCLWASEAWNRHSVHTSSGSSSNSSSAHHEHTRAPQLPFLPACAGKAWISVIQKWMRSRLCVLSAILNVPAGGSGFLWQLLQQSCIAFTPLRSCRKTSSLMLPRKLYGNRIFLKLLIASCKKIMVLVKERPCWTCCHKPRRGRTIQEHVNDFNALFSKCRVI